MVWCFFISIFIEKLPKLNYSNYSFNAMLLKPTILFISILALSSCSSEPKECACEALVGQSNEQPLNDETVVESPNDSETLVEPDYVSDDGVKVFIQSKALSYRPYPSQGDAVEVHYRGALENGDVFDNSYSRGAPGVFKWDEVIECWRQALPFISKDSSATIYCPADTAYGEKGTNGIPGGSNLIFEVEILNIIKES